MTAKKAQDKAADKAEEKEPVTQAPAEEKTEAPAEEKTDEKDAAEEQLGDQEPAEPEGPSDEELAARQDAVIGGSSGHTAGPSQADLNPAYSAQAFEPRSATKE